jgi:hypothetical protein
MANTNAPNGFVPLRHLTGGVIRPQAYPIANAYATSLFSGDLVTLLSGGTVGISTNAVNALGVFYGVQYIDRASGDVKFSKVWTASTAIKDNTAATAFVYDDPNITYQVQGNGTFANANVGELCNVTFTAGETTFGGSQQEADLGTLATTALVLRILRLVDEPNNTVGADAKLEVVINNHLYGTRTSGI